MLKSRLGYARRVLIPRALLNDVKPLCFSSRSISSVRRSSVQGISCVFCMHLLFRVIFRMLVVIFPQKCIRKTGYVVTKRIFFPLQMKITQLV